MVRIAVTGGIACGKSLVGSMLAEDGVAVCEADEIARRLMRPGAPVFDAVVQAFGRGILAADGTIDREILGRRVFSDAAERTRLNALVHPGTRQECERWLEDLARGPRRPRAAAVIVPLLYEAGMEKGWDAVVCVAGPEGVQMLRLAARNLSDEEARLRLAAQMPPSRKMELADYVIFNNGTLDMLRQQTRRVLQSILEI
jgi:dephospho-CoA kinase